MHGPRGFNRKTAYATLAGLLAAEAADLDIFWGFAGPVEELKHHRGITHTFWAVPVIAGVVVGAVWLIDRGEIAPARKECAATNGVLIQGAASSRLGCGTATAYPPAYPLGLALPHRIRRRAQHFLLDWTNNYGVRPFFPLNPHWYAGSFMFIAEPVIWRCLFLAFFMPWVLGLADREIGARRKRFRGRGWAIFALIRNVRSSAAGAGRSMRRPSRFSRTAPSPPSLSTAWPPSPTL